MKVMRCGGRKAEGNLNKSWKRCHNPSLQLMENGTHQVDSLLLLISRTSPGGLRQPQLSCPLMRPCSQICISHLHASFVPNLSHLTPLCQTTAAERAPFLRAQDGGKVWGCPSSWRLAGDSGHPRTGRHIPVPLAQPAGVPHTVTLHTGQKAA